VHKEAGIHSVFPILYIPYLLHLREVHLGENSNFAPSLFQLLTKEIHLHTEFWLPNIRKQPYAAYCTCFRAFLGKLFLTGMYVAYSVCLDSLHDRSTPLPIATVVLGLSLVDIRIPAAGRTSRLLSERPEPLLHTFRMKEMSTCCDLHIPRKAA
jgi:hypothetical protein